MNRTVSTFTVAQHKSLGPNAHIFTTYLHLFRGCGKSTVLDVKLINWSLEVCVSVCVGGQLKRRGKDTRREQNTEWVKIDQSYSVVSFWTHQTQTVMWVSSLCQFTIQTTGSLNGAVYVYLKHKKTIARLDHIFQKLHLWPEVTPTLLLQLWCRNMWVIDENIKRLRN